MQPTPTKPDLPVVAAVDVETTGFVSDYHEIIEVCVLRCAPGTLWVKESLYLRRFPDYPERAFDVGPVEAHRDDANVVCAAEINGFDANTWMEDHITIPDETIARNLCQILDGACLLGSNPDFDRAFLEDFVGRFGLKRTWSRRTFDIRGAALPLYLTGQIKGTGLAHLARALDVPHEAHTARGDATAALEVARRLFNTSLFWSTEHDPRP